MPSTLACLSALVLALGLADASPAAPQKHPVSQRFFGRFVRYAQFAAASVPTDGCPHPPNGAHAIGYINQPSTDTQARLFRDDKAKQIILAFPGTASQTDYGTDGDDALVPYITPGVHCNGCNVHEGFHKAWNSVATQAHNMVANAHKANPGYLIFVTGHSLGAALAAHAYASLKGLGLPIHAAYTYGQPRVGDQNYANYIDKLSGANDQSPGNFYRITHAADPVPNEPGQDLGFVHSRTEFWESGKTTQNARTTFRCYGQEAPDCIDGQQGAPDGNDHLLYSNVDFNNAEQYCS